MEGEVQGDQARRAVEIGGLSGMNPYTGQPTETARSGDEAQKQREFYQGQTLQDRDETRSLREREMREQAAKNHVALAQSSGLPVDPMIVKGTTMEPFAGKILPRTTGQGPAWHQDEAGNWVDLNAAGGPRASGVKGRVPGQEMTAWQVASDKRAQDAAERADAREARAAASEEEKTNRLAEVALSQAQAAINKAKMVSAHPNATPEQKQEAWDAALALADQAIGSHPDLLEAGPREGGFADIRWVGGKKPTARAAAPTGRGRGISQQEYQQQVKKHGQAKVDAWLRDKGITVQ